MYRSLYSSLVSSSRLVGATTGKTAKTLLWDVDLCLNVNWPHSCQGHEWPRLLHPQVSVAGSEGDLPPYEVIVFIREDNGGYDSERH